MGANFKGAPKSSVIEINNVLMQHFEKSKINAKNTKMNKIPKF